MAENPTKSSKRTKPLPPGETDAVTPSGAERRARGRLWADLMRRAFGSDYSTAPNAQMSARLSTILPRA